jgi:hypothetical protein
MRTSKKVEFKFDERSLVTKDDVLTSNAETNKIKHSMEEDFQHFLTYSGYSLESSEFIDKLRRAFEAARQGTDKV